jgi:hypothetical protein
MAVVFTSNAISAYHIETFWMVISQCLSNLSGYRTDGQDTTNVVENSLHTSPVQSKPIH